jgi:hypothetical protein
VKPVVRNLELYRGDTWTETFVFWNDTEKTDPTDLSTATINAQFRATTGGPLVVELGCVVGGVDNNQVAVTLLPAQWETMTPTSFSKGVWDLQVTYSPELVTTYVKGSVTVDADVTREEAP